MKRLGCLLLVLGLIAVVIGALVVRDGLLTQDKLRQEARQVAVPTYFEALDKCPEMVEWATRHDVLVDAVVNSQEEGFLDVTYNIKPGDSHPYPDIYARVQLVVFRQVIQEEGILWYHAYLTDTQYMCDTMSVSSN